jgi:hypothetical protein
VRRFVRHLRGPAAGGPLGARLAGAAARAAAFGLFMLVGALGAGQLGFTWADSSVRVEQEAGEARLDEAAALIARHGCWTREAPPDMAGVIPGHAVVTLPGDDEPSYVGPRWTGRALERVFEGTHEDLVVHAFCR